MCKTTIIKNIALTFEAAAILAIITGGVIYGWRWHSDNVAARHRKNAQLAASLKQYFEAEKVKAAAALEAEKAQLAYAERKQKELERKEKEALEKEQRELEQAEAERKRIEELHKTARSVLAQFKENEFVYCNIANSCEDEVCSLTNSEVRYFIVLVPEPSLVACSSLSNGMVRVSSWVNSRHNDQTMPAEKLVKMLRPGHLTLDINRGRIVCRINRPFTSGSVKTACKVEGTRRGYDCHEEFFPSKAFFRSMYSVVSDLRPSKLNLRFDVIFRTADGNELLVESILGLSSYRHSDDRLLALVKAEYPISDFTYRLRPMYSSGTSKNDRKRVQFDEAARQRRFGGAFGTPRPRGDPAFDIEARKAAHAAKEFAKKAYHERRVREYEREKRAAYEREIEKLITNGKLIWRAKFTKWQAAD